MVPVEVVALDGVGVGHDAGEGPDELHRLEQHVADGGVIGVLVIGVQGQDAAAQLVHDVLTGALHDHVLGEAAGQPPGVVHDLVEVVHLGPGGEIAHEQQIGHLLEAEGPGLPVGLHDLVELDAPVVELAGHRDAEAVLDHIALDGAHPGDADGHAGAVAVSQATLDVSPVVFLGDAVFVLDMLAQGAGVVFQHAGVGSGCDGHVRTSLYV